MDQLDAILHRVLLRLSGTEVTPLSLLIFLGTVALAVVLGQLARRAVSRFFLRRGGSAQEGMAYALGRILQYLVVTLGVMMALDTVGFSIKSLAAAGAVVAVGIGFGLQNIAQNFASGIILLIERPVQKGDFINVGDTVGTVEDIAMRATRILTRDGVQIIVPNSELVSGRVVNRSAPTTRSRVRVTVGVAYGSDTERVRRTLLAVAAGDTRVLREPTPTVFFKEFGDSALIFDLAVWIDTPQLEFVITSDLRFAIDRAFREAELVIAFPQRDLHLVSGLEGLVAALSGDRPPREQ